MMGRVLVFGEASRWRGYSTRSLDVLERRVCKSSRGRQLVLGVVMVVVVMARSVSEWKVAKRMEFDILVVVMAVVLGSFVATSRAGPAAVLAITIIFLGLSGTLSSSGLDRLLGTHLLKRSIRVVPAEHTRA